MNLDRRWELYYQRTMEHQRLEWSNMTYSKFEVKTDFTNWPISEPFAKNRLILVLEMQWTASIFPKREETTFGPLAMQECSFQHTIEFRVLYSNFHNNFFSGKRLQYRWHKNFPKLFRTIFNSIISFFFSLKILNVVFLYRFFRIFFMEILFFIY